MNMGSLKYFLHRQIINSSPLESVFSCAMLFSNDALKRHK